MPTQRERWVACGSETFFPATYYSKWTRMAKERVVIEHAFYFNLKEKLHSMKVYNRTILPQICWVISVLGIILDYRRDLIHSRSLVPLSPCKSWPSTPRTSDGVTRYFGEERPAGLSITNSNLTMTPTRWRLDFRRRFVQDPIEYRRFLISA